MVHWNNGFDIVKTKNQHEIYEFNNIKPTIILSYCLTRGTYNINLRLRTNYFLSYLNIK